jgi:hypothetical protein
MLKKSPSYDMALSFWTISFQYLMLVENIARETASSANPLGLIKNVNAGPIIEDEFAEATRWSDHTLVIPLLFNLYHGIELLIKGYLLITPGIVVEPKHSIQHLCREFSKAYPSEIEINSFLNKYTEEDQLPFILSNFLKDNALTFNSLYQALRYPSDLDFKVMKRYMQLKYKGQQGILFFQELHEVIKSMRPHAVRLGRSLKTINDNNEEPNCE